MAINFTRNILSSGYNVLQINDNFAKIETALKDGLSRTGSTPNQMNADIDMNGNDIINIGTVSSDLFILNGSPILPSDSLTSLPPGIVTDSLLSSSSNVGINNTLITSPAFHGGSIETMFASSFRVFIIPAGTYSFSSQIVIPSNSYIIASADAVFQPTFEPTGAGREIPFITVSSGVTANSLRLFLPSGIDTVKIGFKVLSNTSIDYIEAVSTNLNNNRTAPGSADLVSGAVLINGDHVRIGQIYISRFDRGWAVVDSNDVVINKIRNLETLMGGYVHGTRDLHIMAGYTTGASTTDAATLNRGPMTPGLNSFVLAGCSDSSISNWYSYDILEHAVRVGATASGTTVPNQRLSFVNHQHYRPYGCGFKMDDGDAFTIKKITIQGLYVEDVGHDNWFGNPGYQNWSSGGVNNPAVNNDGNKAAVAIRNSQYVTAANISSKTNLYTNSGNIGFWVERSNYVQASNIDVERAKTDGVVIQSGSSTSPERIELRGVATRENTNSGLKFDATPSNDVWRGVVVFDLDSQNNSGYGVEITANLGGTNPYTTIKSRVSGYLSGNTLGGISIASAVSPTNFQDDTEEEGTFTPSITFDTPGNLALTSVTASGTWKRKGRRVKVESSFTGTPTFTTSSGNLRLTGLPFNATSGLALTSIMGMSAFTWPSSRSQLEVMPQNAANYCIIRGYGTGIANSTPVASTNLTSASAFTFNYAMEYSI